MNSHTATTAATPTISPRIQWPLAKNNRASSTSTPAINAARRRTRARSLALPPTLIATSHHAEVLASSMNLIRCQPNQIQGVLLESGSPSANQVRLIAHRVDLVGLDGHDHAALTRLEVRVLVLADVLLRQLVDVVVRALLGDLGRPGDGHVTRLLVLRGQDRYGDARVATQVPFLRASDRGVEDHVLAVGVDPDRRRVRRAVFAERDNRAPVLPAEELRLLFRQLRHSIAPCSIPRCSPQAQDATRR